MVDVPEPEKSVPGQTTGPPHSEERYDPDPPEPPRQESPDPANHGSHYGE